MKHAVLRFAAVCLSGDAAAQQPPASIPADQAAMRAHVAGLASDELKGRVAGTPERQGRRLVDGIEAAVAVRFILSLASFVSLPTLFSRPSWAIALVTVEIDDVAAAFDVSQRDLADSLQTQSLSPAETASLLSRR